MAGHSKWATIKRAKAVTDARRAKVWARITRDIMVAARDGLPDPAHNARLALAVEKARGVNMPKDNIERAIKRGSGEIAGADFEELTYEGYGPGGVAIFVEALTDNPNRTVADLRVLFSRAGGSLGTSGSVAFQFERKGVIEVGAEGQDEEALFLTVAEAGAEDLEREDDVFVVTTPVEAFGAVQAALREAGADVREASLQRSPTTTTDVDPETAQRVATLLEKIDEHADIQAVYSTLSPDAVEV
ncbi:MAG TPA: YebC/PmpR family DNA-binding transcriptional regulator [Rhodothermales bacterium]|nr:YebC/PmpR family DNA-binding transcriptional regulator [Rhodothermales bacterium]